MMPESLPVTVCVACPECQSLVNFQQALAKECPACGYHGDWECKVFLRPGCMPVWDERPVTQSDTSVPTYPQSPPLPSTNQPAITDYSADSDAPTEDAQNDNPNHPASE